VYIRPRTPHLNGKVKRSHRVDDQEFSARPAVRVLPVLLVSWQPVDYLKRFHGVSIACTSVHRILCRHGRSANPAAFDVMRLVLGNAAQLTLIDLTIGLIAAAALTRYLSTLLYAVKPLDPVTFIAVPVVLVATAAIAVAVPAWRAARVDPVVAFRSE
jgi:hypothetical protein